MKIWVDKSPNACCVCKFMRETRAKYFYCNAHAMRYGYPVASKSLISLHDQCPLQSIADHDTEITEQVCEKIRKTAFSSKVICDKNGSSFYGEKNHTLYGIYDYELDEIERGVK